MSLSNLPVEIIQLVCEQLSQRDLCSFRETCRQNAALGAPKAFRTVHLMFRRKSFENLICIASDPTLSHYVKGLLYHGYSLEWLDDYSEWETYLLTPIATGETILLNEKILEMESNRPDFATEREQRVWNRTLMKLKEEKKSKHWYTREQLDDGWEAYMQITSEQRDMQVEKFDLQAMVQAFPKLPNLKQIIVARQGELMFERDCKAEAVMAAFRSTLVGAGRIRATEDDAEDQEAGSYHIWTLMQAVDLAFTNLERLVLDEVPLGTFATRDAAEDETGLIPSQERWTSTFQFLTDLRLDVASADDEDEWDWTRDRPAEIKSLGAAIQSAQALVSIHLGFGCATDTIEERRWVRHIPQLDELVNDCTWPSLKKLTLVAAHTPEAALVGLIKRHSSTLEEVTLSGIDLSRGEWGTAFQELKPAMRNVRNIRLTGEFGMDYNDAYHGSTINLCMDHEDVWEEPDEYDEVLGIGSYMEEWLGDLDDKECPILTLAEAMEHQPQHHVSILREMPCAQDLFREPDLLKLRRRALAISELRLRVSQLNPEELRKARYALMCNLEPII